MIEAPISLHRIARTFRSRLTWRVTAAVFIAILVIEGVILIPSYSRHETELLGNLDKLAQTLAALATSRSEEGKSTPHIITQDILHAPGVTGVASAAAHGDFQIDGEAPRFGLYFESVEPVEGRRDPGRNRYDVVVLGTPSGVNERIIIRFDTTALDAELSSYLFRIAWLVALIGSFVTIVAMAVLDGLVLWPLLQLRDRLLQAEGDPGLTWGGSGTQRKDEIGDLYRAVGVMRGRISESMRDVSAIARFPEENPNPVLRCSREGDVIYANEASKKWTCFFADAERTRISDQLKKTVSSALDLSLPQDTEVSWQDVIFSVQVAPFSDLGYANIYGRDVTEQTQAENQIAALNKNLELRVLDRTEELSATNFALEAEITNRQRAEEQLAAKSALLQGIIESLPAGISAMDGDLNFLTANTRYYELLDFPRERFGDDSCFEDFIRYNAERGEYGPGDVEEQIAERVALAKNFQPHCFERARPDGKILEIRGDTLPQGGFVTTYVDVTERRRAEELNTRLGRIFEDSTNEIFVFDSETLRFVQVNNAAIQNLGFPIDELRARTPVDIMPEYDHENFLDLIDALKTGEKRLLYFETLHQRKDGTNYNVEIRLQISTQETPPLFVALILDITKRKKVESELRLAKEQAELANHVKSEFLANMSHELRTPLNAILGFSEAIKNQISGPVGNERYTEYAKDIHDSGSHLLSIINDILDLSKIEAGESELYEDSIDLNSVISDCLRVVQHRASDSGINIETNVSETPLVLFADERKIKQVLINLLSNAVKFTSEGGCIEIGAARAASGALELFIQDTGIGISEEDIPRALSPFTQVDGSLTRSHEGTGLGLPLAKSLTELHGGSLELSSKIGAGTTVTIHLPEHRVIS